MIVRFSNWAMLRRPPAFRWAFAAAAFAIAFALRYALDGELPPGFPYLTFFPAVIVTAFFAGIREAIAVAVLCGLAA